MKVYEVLIGGIPHTMQLEAADAEARGLVPVAEDKAATADRRPVQANKKVVPATK